MLKNKQQKRTDLTPDINFPIVGIGASAGGLKAFIRLLEKIPANTGMAFVLVQHISPKYKSMSTEIISRTARLKIEEARQGMVVMPNNIYMIPPGHSMRFSNGALQLSSRGKSVGSNMLIDMFLESLAESAGERAVGVLLSGTGSDGTRGLNAIKAKGGLTYAQDPKSAEFPPMPASAIAAGVVDFVLTPENIAKALISRKKQRNQRDPVGESAQDRRSFKKIYRLLHAHTNVDFTDYKQTTVKRRIERRMAVTRTGSFHEYAAFLDAHPQEIEILYNDILINVTNFFRDPDAFDALAKHVFPVLAEKPAGTTIRIWVPGCSSGEETYSIAIALSEYLSKTRKLHSVQIFATDISEMVIQKARTALYPEDIEENVPSGLLTNYFDKVDGGYKIKKKIRDMCLFSRHDVTNDPSFSKLDLISCRNVLIYFNPVLQKRVMPIFHYALNPGGFLWLGKSENPGGCSQLFNLVEKTEKIYLKSNVVTPLGFRYPSKVLHPPQHSEKKFSMLSDAGKNFQKDADKLLLAKFAPPGVVINGNYEILQFRGRTSPFLEPSGTPSMSLLKMVHSELLTGVRATVQGAKKNNKVTVRRGVHFEFEDRDNVVDIETHPLSPFATAEDSTYLVLFRRTTSEQAVPRTKKSPPQGKKRGDERDKRIRELLLELSEMKDYQQSLIDQFETRQEELTMANEELQSTNEEFVSANEEIETAKEELQSTNEELMTVNEELQMRNADLTILSNDLNNLLSSIDMPVLIVDGKRNIRRFSPKAKGTFNLIPSDVGRPVNDIKPNFNYDLDNLVAEMSESLIPREVEVQDKDGSWQRLQIRPFRTAENKIEGAIITLIDIDALKQNEIKTSEALAYVTSIADAVPIPLAAINSQFQLRSANQSFCAYFRMPQGVSGQGVFSVLPVEQKVLSHLEDLFSNAIARNKPFSNVEIDCDSPVIGRRKIQLSGKKINWGDDEQQALLISFVDVTEQRKLEEGRNLLLSGEKEARNQADKANRAKDAFLATLSHELRTPLSSILSWAQLINQGRVDFEKAKEGAAVIEQSAKAQSQLIDDLLDISRIISGKLALQIQTVDPRTAIKAAIESVRAAAERKFIEIQFEINGETEVINADPVRLQQIVWNLLSNAIKFSPKKSTILVQLSYVSEGNARFAEIKVNDHGKGIPPEFLPLIFDRFSQADSASTRVHGGLGLGLSIVRNLVELQQGTVKAENAHGAKGAIFTVRFPVASADKSAIIQTELDKNKEQDAEDNGDSAPQLDGLRILFVDDDQSAREAICIYLRSFGAEVLAVASADEVLERLPHFKPHVLVSDIAMPGQNGYSLIKKIRSLKQNNLSSTPALALTAFATAEDARTALSAGFQGHIAKPVEAHELGRLILKVCGRK